jgi:cell shape-determining protein MreD
LSVLLPLDSLLLPTVLTGLISDYYSGGDFGLHIAYYLLIALVSKLVFRLGEKEPSTVIIVLLAIGFNLLYSFMRIIGTQHFLLVNGWITIISVLLGRVIITGLLTWALLPVIKTFYQRLGKWSHFYAK